MVLRAGQEFIKFATLGVVAAIKRATSANDSERFLHDALAGMPGAPAKIGQLLGMRAREDIPSPQPMELEVVKTLIAKHAPLLNAEIDTLSTWAKSASLGQTHQARLRDGRVVAIKLQYPAIAESLSAQMSVFFGLAAVSPARKYDFDLVSTRDFLRQKLLEETDYLHEATMQKRFFELFHRTDVVIPKVYDAFSSPVVLVQSWEESQSAKEVVGTWLYRDVITAARLWTWFLLESIFRDGLVHTDLNPANYGFRKDGTQVKLVLYDFGSTYELTVEQRQALYRWLIATRSREAQGVYDALLSMGFDRRRLQPIATKLLDLSQLLLQPWLEGRAWQAEAWDMQKRFDALLGADKWWFRTAGPPWFLYLMRTVQGWHHGLLTLNTQIDFMALWQPWDERLFELAQSRPASKEPLDKVAKESRARFQPVAKTLRVRVTEGFEEVVLLELPASAVEDLQTLLPDHVVERCVQDGVDIPAIERQAIANGGIPQDLFSAEFGKRQYKVWLQ